MNDSFLEYIQDQFKIIGPVNIKKMFGGAGLFLNGKMFGLLANEQIYLKTNSTTQKDYEALNMPPFTYTGKNKPIKMSYHQLPEECLEDSEKLKEWAQKAIIAAKNPK